MLQKYKYIYDLTKVLDENTKVFPGDPSFTQERLCSTENDAFELRYLHVCNHTGTHIDFPSHVIKKGKTSSNYTINDLIAKCNIIDYAKGFSRIKQQLDQITIHPFIFFNHVEFLSEEIADYLISRSIKLVGVDSLSVDEISDEDLTIHNKLLAKGILIVENLNLENISEGEGYTVIAPLNIANIDGVQVRVIMWR
jgi:arylformamidase